MPYQFKLPVGVTELSEYQSELEKVADDWCVCYRMDHNLYYAFNIGYIKYKPGFGPMISEIMDICTDEKECSYENSDDFYNHYNTYFALQWKPSSGVDEEEEFLFML